MSVMGVYSRDIRPVIIDLQVDSTRSLSSRTKQNIKIANAQLQKNVRRSAAVYNNITKNVNTIA